MVYYSEIYGTPSGMFLHYFQIITNFLFVCQYAFWLTYLQKSGEYNDITSYGCMMFLNLFWHIPHKFID